METYICLTNWSCKHQDKFILLLEMMPPKEQQQIIKKFVFNALDSDEAARFRKAFRRHQSPVIKKILKEIDGRHLEEWK